MRTFFATLDINVEDLDYLFEMLESSDEQIDIKTFTDGMGRIKGPAKSIDMLKLHNDTQALSRKLDTVITEVQNARAVADGSKSAPEWRSDGSARVKPQRPEGLEPDPMMTI